MNPRLVVALLFACLASVPAAAQFEILAARDQEVWINQGFTRSIALDYDALGHSQNDLVFEVTSVADKLRLMMGSAAPHRIVVKAREDRIGDGEIRWRLCSRTFPVPCTAEATLTVHIRNPATLADQVLVPNDALWNAQWGLKNGSSGAANGRAAWWYNTDCTSRIVAVVDTGTDYTHPDLADNIWINRGEIPWNGTDDDGNGYIDDLHGYDFADQDSDPYPHSSDCRLLISELSGHGTNTAGVIGAVADNQIGTAGVCWDAQIMIVKAARCFLFADGGSSWRFPTSAVLEGLAYANANGAKISNNSHGYLSSGPTGNAIESRMIEELRAAGHIFVAAAGNAGVNLDAGGGFSHWASYPQTNIIAVGTLLPNGNYDVGYSNRGTTTVDLAAPGDIIPTPTVVRDRPEDAYYLTAGGTSLAAPHVAGAVALTWSLHPQVSWSEARRYVLDGSFVRPELTNYVRLGRQLDLPGALALLSSPGGCGINPEVALMVPVLQWLWVRRRRARRLRDLR
jgi:subtilisin family serine protease